MHESKKLSLSPENEIGLKPCANGRKVVGQQLPTLLDVTCCVRLHTLLHVVGCCCVLLPKVWNRSNFSANNSQHFFCSVIAKAKRNNVGYVCTALPTLLGPRTLITHFTKTYGLYPSHDAMQVPTLLGVVASVCTPLPTCTQQLPTLLARQCWEVLRPFARSPTGFAPMTPRFWK